VSYTPVLAPDPVAPEGEDPGAAFPTYTQVDEPSDPSPGETWLQLPPPMPTLLWTPDTQYGYNAAVQPTTPNGFIYAFLHGTTGSEEPEWTTGLDDPVPDGTGTWYCQGPVGNLGQGNIDDGRPVTGALWIAVDDPVDGVIWDRLFVSDGFGPGDLRPNWCAFRPDTGIQGVSVRLSANEYNGRCDIQTLDDHGNGTAGIAVVSANGGETPGRVDLRIWSPGSPDDPVGQFKYDPDIGKWYVIGDMLFETGYGPIVKSPDETLYRITVQNDGALSTEVVT
jgi:hypothetical protein